jgi:hypothetical protein
VTLGAPPLKPAAAPADASAVAPAAGGLCIRAERERPAPDVVLEWRFDELERVGVDVVRALRLALDPSFDVGAVRALVGRGCAVELALRIVR